MKALLDLFVLQTSPKNFEALSHNFEFFSDGHSFPRLLSRMNRTRVSSSKSLHLYLDEGSAKLETGGSVDSNDLSSVSDSKESFFFDLEGLFKDLGCNGFFPPLLGVSPVGDQALFLTSR